MAQAAIFYNNLIDNATLTASSEAIAVSNLQSFQLGEVWRTTSVIDEYVQADLGQSEYMPYIALMRHNLSGGACIRIQISNNSDMSSPVYDVEFWAWPSIVGYDEDLYDIDIGYDGVPILDNFLATQYYSTFLLSDTALAKTNTANDGTYTGRYLRITITDGGSTDNYIQAGWLGAGSLIQPAYDIDFNAELEWVDASDSYLSYGQNTWINQKNKYRVASFSFSFLSENEARNQFFQLRAQAGSSKPVIYIPYLENSFRAYSDTIYGIIQANAPIRQVRKNYTGISYAIAMQIKELI